MLLRFTKPVDGFIFPQKQPTIGIRKKKHMACREKYKPCILKYKALILKYVPYIFRHSKHLINSNLQKLFNSL